MSDIVIEPYGDSVFDEVVDLLADANLTNPTNVAVFGSGERERRLNRAMFGVMLKSVLPRCCHRSATRRNVC